jgi:exopolyphosphatase/pppGpp-phosphohydrolase
MDTSAPDAALQTLLTRTYANGRLSSGPGRNIVVLHIGNEQCGIAAGGGLHPQTLYALPMGSERTAREHFRSDPPTALAMENAIAAVEDVVMPLRPLLPREALLYTQDAALREIATLAGVPVNEPVLTLESMEQCFDRLTAVVMGSPAGGIGLPESRSFAARLLILREFMHHMQFAQLEFVRS